MDQKTRLAAAKKTRLERTLKKTNKRIAGGWADPLSQKARLEKRLADTAA